MDLFWGLIILEFGILASAFFSGYETGLISINRVRLQHLVERQNRRAAVLASFVNRPDKLLGTTLIGNNIANVLVSVLATSLLASVFGLGYQSELVAVVIVSCVVLIFGEIVPKTLFRRYAHRLCLTFVDVLNVCAWLFAPGVVLLGGAMRWLQRLGSGGPPRSSLSVTREELKHLAREGEVGGELSGEEREMILGVFDFPFKTVFEVMVPLARTVTVSRDTTVAELLEVSERTGFARFPVRDGRQIVGVANVYEALFDPHVDGSRTTESLMRPPQQVLSTERINHVLPRLRASRLPLSVVINPEGQHVGIVSLEDIVEEIVGDVEG